MITLSYGKIMRIFFGLFLLIITTSVFSSGYFEGRVIVEWIEDEGPDRKMKLHENIKFTDSSGEQWLAPKGWVVDGASIPRIFWTLIGPPFVGDYRRASVIHDYYCDVKTKPWKTVHRMFYHASIAGDVPESKAKVMYAAVYAAGPRWKKIKKIQKGGVYPLSVEQIYTASPEVDEAKISEISQWVESSNPSLEDIENRLNSFVKDNLPIDSSSGVFQ